MSGISIITDRTAHKFETITVGTTLAVSFTATTIAPTSGSLKNNVCKEAFCVLSTNSIRFTYHQGGTPTAEVGIPLYNGQDLTLKDVANVQAFKAIAADSSATTNDLPVLHCTYSF